MQAHTSRFAPPATLALACALTGALTGVLWPFSARADGMPPAEDWNLKAQTTYIWQKKPAFHAAYSGANSLAPEAEKSYSFSATVFAGLRLARDTELYLNPELVQGAPLSGLVGMGGLSNGELQKTSGSHPKLYRARLFVRQSWALGDEREAVESDANQLGGTRAKDRVVLTAGNLAVSDLFDANAYAHDARSQFMNWSLLTHGAFDFAADTRGYSIGAALEYIRGDWALRAGRFELPRQPNGQSLDTRLFSHHGDQIELERGYDVGGLIGKVRALWFRNTAIMGQFGDALDLAAQQASGGQTADTAAVRHRQHKQGWGLAWEQGLTKDLGAFARVARSDGRSEVYAFAEIDQSASAGLALQGGSWGRGTDTVGLAIAQNGLSTLHQRYLASGANGFFVGDGALDYRAERTLEGYYSLSLPDGWAHHSTVSLDVQHTSNPAYNRDRGPVMVWGIRLHTQL